MNVPKYKPTNFRIWNTFNLSNISTTESEQLKKLVPASNIPIDKLKAQIASFRHINTDKKKQSWIYIVGGGSGSGFILLVIICGCHPNLKARSPTHVTYTAPENPNMMHTQGNAIRTGIGSDLGHKTVGIQDPVSDKGKVTQFKSATCSY